MYEHPASLPAHWSCYTVISLPCCCHPSITVITIILIGIHTQSGSAHSRLSLCRLSPIWLHRDYLTGNVHGLIIARFEMVQSTQGPASTPEHHQQRQQGLIHMTNRQPHGCKWFVQKRQVIWPHMQHCAGSRDFSVCLTRFNPITSSIGPVRFRIQSLIVSLPLLAMT